MFIPDFGRMVSRETGPNRGGSTAESATFLGLVGIGRGAFGCPDGGHVPEGELEALAEDFAGILV